MKIKLKHTFLLNLFRFIIFVMIFFIILDHFRFPVWRTHLAVRILAWQQISSLQSWGGGVYCIKHFLNLEIITLFLHVLNIGTVTYCTLYSKRGGTRGGSKKVGSLTCQGGGGGLTSQASLTHMVAGCVVPLTWNSSRTGTRVDRCSSVWPRRSAKQTAITPHTFYTCAMHKTACICPL